MSYLHDERGEDVRVRSREPEVTLGTGTILAIFFGLVVLCGAFFGLGYSFGSKGKPAVPPLTTTATATNNPNFGSFKPSSGTPAAQTNNAVVPPKDESTASAIPGPIVPETPESTPTASVPSAHSREVATPAVHSAPIAHPAVATSDSAATGSFIVQVAAVTHQEDAELLISALKRKGYPVTSRTEPQDKLFHIQVGPFASKKDAESMKDRLLVDGYKAFLK